MQSSHPTLSQEDHWPKKTGKKVDLILWLIFPPVPTQSDFHQNQ